MVSPQKVSWPRLAQRDDLGVIHTDLQSCTTNSTGKLSLSTPGRANGNSNYSAQSDSAPKTSTSLRRNGGDTGLLGRSNTLTSGGSLVSPTNASSAFSIGSGAFAGFGSKTPKTPGGGSPFELSLGAAAAGAKAAAAKVAKDKSAAPPFSSSASKTPTASKGAGVLSTSKPPPPPPFGTHRLSHTWVFWFRPPIPKSNDYMEYEKTLHPIARVSTAEEFFAVYRHLKRASDLPAVSDYHLFRHGIRPIWEDDVNKQGGKWVVRVRKGVADRYWEDLLLAMVGCQFDLEDVCGIVLSVRNGEDIISIWAKSDGGRVLKIRFVPTTSPCSCCCLRPMA